MFISYFLLGDRFLTIQNECYGDASSSEYIRQIFALDVYWKGKRVFLHKLLTGFR